jgi:hypothetical protein
MNRRHALLAGLVGLALAPAAGRAQEKGQRKKGGGASYIQINTLTATILHANGSRGVMTVESGVDVPDAGLRARAEQAKPLLQAAFDEVVRNYAVGLPAAAVPNADYLARELQRQTDMVLGRPGAHLLLGTILVN